MSNAHSDMVARMHLDLRRQRLRIEELEGRLAEMHRDRDQLLQMVECLAGGWRSAGAQEAVLEAAFAPTPGGDFIAAGTPCDDRPEVCEGGL